MRAACNLPRISTCTLVAAVFGTRASAMERFKVGEKVPLVTSPVGSGADVSARAGGRGDFPAAPATTTFW